MTDTDVATYMPEILDVAHRFYRDPNTADDAAQLTVIALMSVWDSHDPARGTRKSWVRRIAHNCCYRHTRRRPAHRTLVTDPLTHDPDPEEDLTALAERHLKTRLTPRQERIIDLIFRWGCTCGEAAIILGLARMTVNKAMSDLGIRTQDVNARPARGPYKKRRGHADAVADHPHATCNLQPSVSEV